jgi:ribosomal protein L32
VVIDFFFRDGAIEYYTPEHSVTTPGDARRALTVGAVNWSTDALEDYSSRGPTGDGRLKPEISAPAGVSSAAFGTTWDGTSASAPHVSGAAALVLQAFPGYTPDQVRDFLLSRAIDLGPGGPDTGYGYGRLYLGQAPDLSALIVTTPTPLPSVTPTTSAPGATATITATPERRDLSTPVSTTGDGSVNLALGLAICVVIPAVLGLGGIGLVAGVWYVTRNRRPRRGGPPRRYPGGAPPPPGYSPPPGGPGRAQYTPVRPHIQDENTCPRCGSEHRPGARFCPVCGLALAPELYTDAERPIADLIRRSGTPPPAAPLADEPAKIVFCNQCGQQLRPNSKFCPRCGAPRSGT